MGGCEPPGNGQTWGRGTMGLPYVGALCQEVPTSSPHLRRLVASGLYGLCPSTKLRLERDLRAHLAISPYTFHSTDEEAVPQNGTVLLNFPSGADTVSQPNQHPFSTPFSLVCLHYRGWKSFILASKLQVVI